MCLRGAHICWNDHKWVSNRASGTALTSDSQREGVRSQSNGAKTTCNIFFPSSSFCLSNSPINYFMLGKIFARASSLFCCVRVAFGPSTCRQFPLCRVFVILFYALLIVDFVCEFYSCQTLRWLTKRFSFNAPAFLLLLRLLLCSVYFSWLCAYSDERWQWVPRAQTFSFILRKFTTWNWCLAKYFRDD